MHAFGYGLPVVTSAKGGIQGPEIEAFEDGINGVSCEAGDWRSLSNAIAGLLADPGRAAEIGRNGLATATQSYSLGRMVNGLEQAIRFAARQSAAKVA